MNKNKLKIADFSYPYRRVKRNKYLPIEYFMFHKIPCVKGLYI